MKPSKTGMLNQITARMIDKSSNATRTGWKAQNKKNWWRVNSAKNRRQVDICITEKGLKLLLKIDDVMNAQMLPAHYVNVTKDELDQLNLILDKIRN